MNNEGFEQASREFTVTNPKKHLKRVVIKLSLEHSKAEKEMKIENPPSERGFVFIGHSQIIRSLKKI